MEHFDPEQALALIERYHVTASQWVPTMFIRMLKLPEEVRDRYDVSSLQVGHPRRRAVPGGGQGADDRVVGPGHPRVLRRHRGQRLRLHRTPTTGSSTRARSAGTCSARSTSSTTTATSCPIGEAGTIYFAGAGEFEYHNDPAKTDESRDPRGWSTLGDIGRLDEDGFLYLTDRKSYMIISGGVNIYPQEAENVLSMHPKVHDVAVIGVPNPDFGEEVKAVVQPVDMADAGPDLERELIAYCREHLADVKCPRSVDFVDELPRHPTGKLYKRLLRDQYWAGHESKLI